MLLLPLLLKRGSVVAALLLALIAAPFSLHSQKQLRQLQRPVSVLTCVLLAESKRCRNESDVQFVGRWHQLNLTVVADSHFHINGKDSTGCDIWAPERDRVDVYPHQNRQLVNDPSEISREKCISPDTGGTVLEC